MVEHLLCKQGVRGSIPLVSTNRHELKKVLNPSNTKQKRSSLKKIYFENFGLNREQIKLFYKYGYEVAKDNKDCAAGIYVDPFEFPKTSNGKKILYIHEPEVVRPDLYRRKYLKKYDHLITISKDRSARLNADFTLELPINLPSYKKRNTLRTKQIALINEHKFSASKRSMYGFRRKLILQAEKKGINIDLYGKQWIEGKKLEIKRRLFALKFQLFAFKPVDIKEISSDLFKVYANTRGLTRTADCQELLLFETSIVIENDSDYVSEKIWKSLYAGAVPFYVGPHHLLPKDVQKSIYICTNSITKIIKKITNLNQNEIYQKRKLGSVALRKVGGASKNNRIYVIKLVKILNEIFDN